jgi:type I restriction enzyme S subunit
MSSWQRKALGEVIQLEYGKPLPPEDRDQNGLYPAYGANGEKVRTNRFYRDEPTIIVGRKGSAGEITLSESKYWPLDVTYFTEFDRQRHELRFLYYLLSNLDLPSLAKGVKPGINRNEVYGIPVAVPSLAEQRRIVAILDEAFEAIAIAKANARKNLRNARELFESHREVLLTNAGCDWGESLLSDLCDIKHGYAFEGEFFAQEGEYVLLTPGNYSESGGYRDRGEKQKYFTGPIPSDYVLQEGNLLVAMTEQAAGLLGSPLLVPESDRFLHNQRLGLVVGKPDRAWINEFFFHVFNLKRVRAEIHASASGVKVRHTSPSKIGAVRVNFPKTVNEQREVAARLDKFALHSDQLAQVLENKSIMLDDLKKSLLHQAFTGQLTAKTTDQQLAEVA